MRFCLSLLLGAAVLAVAAPTSDAQIFGAKKPKTPPQQRVPELIMTLRADNDARKRADAAEELRQFEPKDFPEIIPVLIDALQADQGVNVRIEAATSLGRLRPISLAAGAALEKASSADSNIRVRLQASTSLMYYKLSGYHAPKKTDPQQGPPLTGRTDEPPLAVPGGSAGNQWWNNNNSPGAKSVPVLPGPPSNVPRPMPSGPTQNPKVPVVSPPTAAPQAVPLPGPTIPTVPPILQTPPPQTQWGPVQEEGPKLILPK